MADERITPAGWLPPVAPGGGPPPRFDGPASEPQPQPQQPPAHAGERNRAAAWALALAISALAMLLVSLGTLFVVTLPASAASWALALQARGRVERGETSAGEGQATAALWIARIGVVAGVAAAVVLIALLASGFDFEQFRDDLERELEQRRDRRSDGVRTSVEGLRAVIGR